MHYARCWNAPLRTSKINLQNSKMCSGFGGSRGQMIASHNMISWCSSHGKFYAYLSLFDFVRMSNNAPANCPSFFAFRRSLTCSSVKDRPALKIVSKLTPREMYIFSKSLFESFGSDLEVLTVLAFLRSLACIRNVKVSLKPTDSASPLISVLPPAATSSTDLHKLDAELNKWGHTRIFREYFGTPTHQLDAQVPILLEVRLLPWLLSKCRPYHMIKTCP
jgi:hypothetical protein